MLSCLCIDTVVSSHIQYCSVRLACTCDHIFDEVTVTGSVDDSEVIIRSVELLVSYIDGDTTCALLLQAVHDIGQTESGLSCLGS